MRICPILAAPSPLCSHGAWVFARVLIHVPLSGADGPLKCKPFGLGARLLAQAAEPLGPRPWGPSDGVKIFGHFGFAWAFGLPEWFLVGVLQSKGLAFGWIIWLWRLRLQLLSCRY